MTAATGFAGRYEAGSGTTDTETSLKRLRWLANFLDTAVSLPGGFRFGADSLIGCCQSVAISRRR